MIFLFLAHYVERAICYRPSVCLSLCRMGGSAKTVEVKIMPGKFNPLDTASKFALFLVSGLKDEKLTKINTYMKTETRKLYSRVLWIFLPNVIKMDPYNVELYRFKVDVFCETQCSFPVLSMCRVGWQWKKAIDWLIDWLYVWLNCVRISTNKQLDDIVRHLV